MDTIAFECGRVFIYLHYTCNYTYWGSGEPGEKRFPEKIGRAKHLFGFGLDYLQTVFLMDFIFVIHSNLDRSSSFKYFPRLLLASMGHKLLLATEELMFYYEIIGAKLLCQHKHSTAKIYIKYFN